MFLGSITIGLACQQGTLTHQHACFRPFSGCCDQLYQTRYDFQYLSFQTSVDFTLNVFFHHWYHFVYCNPNENLLYYYSKLYFTTEYFTT